MSLLQSRDSAASQVWSAVSERMQRNYHICLKSLIQENPPFLDIDKDALEDPVTRSSVKVALNRPETGRPLQRIHEGPEKNGVMQKTFLTQPAMMTAQLLATADYREKFPEEWRQVQVVAGHSLGEFSALAAVGIFSPEVAVDLVFKRGVLMEETLQRRSSHVAFASRAKPACLLYACNPSRAQLVNDLVAPSSPANASHPNDTSQEEGDSAQAVSSSTPTAADLLNILIEMIAQSLQHTSSFLELVNINVEQEQYVVAGDAVSLSALGKVLDPQWRANSYATSYRELVQKALQSVKMDEVDAVTWTPNVPEPKPFVSSSMRRYGRWGTFQRAMEGPDDGRTPPIEKLSFLTLEDDGRSGLKRKSWFMPIPVEVPFHSSLLRRAGDRLYPILLEALPSDETVTELLSPGSDVATTSSRTSSLLPRAVHWVTNLTGTAFRLDAMYREAVVEALSSQNIGETHHHGKYLSTMTDEWIRTARQTSSPRELLAVTLAAQLAHPVMWTDSMKAMVCDLRATSVTEVAPVKTLSDMFRRGKFDDVKTGASIPTPTVRCYPE